MQADAGWRVSESAAGLHRAALVCDFTVPYSDIGDPALKRGLLPRYAASGVDCVSLSVGGDTGNLADTMKLIARVRVELAAEPSRYLLVERPDDVRAARAEGRLAVMFNFQGTDPLEGSLAMVGTYAALGVRHMGLAYNLRNRVGDGCFEPSDAGLSQFGRRLVREMNRVGMLIDGSHCGRRTALEATDLSDSPVIYSHSNPAGMQPHPRNIDDDQIRACARSGGVVGVLGVSNMLGTGNEASAALLVRHVDYCVQLVGIDHVGFSLDYVFDPVATFAWATAQAGGALPAGGNYSVDMALLGPEQYPGITAELMGRGYAEGDIRKLLGENWMRVCETVWKRAG